MNNYISQTDTNQASYPPIQLYHEDELYLMAYIHKMGDPLLYENK